MSNRSWFFLTWVMGPMILLSLGLAGCDPTETTSLNRIQEADSAMASAMYRLLHADEPSDLDGIDFTTPNALYRETIAADPTVTAAHLGAAITEIMKLNVDREIIDTRDDFENYFDTADFWGRNNLNKAQGPSMRKRLNLRISPFSQTLNTVDEGLIIEQYTMMSKVALANPPLISEVQNIIKNKILPAVTYALARLEVVEQTPGFTYAVTPQMQGNWDADPRELDMTEVKAFHGALLSLRASFKVFNAYDFDIADYSGDGVVAALQPGSSFFTLNGNNELGTARTDLMDATDVLVGAIDFLQNETDNQDDDIIKIGNEVSTGDLDDMRNTLMDVKSGLDNSEVLENFNDTGMDLTVSFKQFFTNPIQDFKTKLPSYSVTVFDNSCGESDLFWKWNDVNFPDPQMNNIFPNIVSSDQFKQFFDIDIDTVGRETMTASVAGQFFEACDVYGYGYTFGPGGYLYIEGDRNVEEDGSYLWEEISISIDNFIGVGTYALGGINPTGYASYYKDSYSGFENYYLDATHTGTLNVTYYDSQIGVAGGTFSFTGYNSSTLLTKSITNGTFYLRTE